MHRSSVHRADRPFHPRRALVALIPVLALLATTGLPAGALDEPAPTEPVTEPAPPVMEPAPPAAEPAPPPPVTEPAPAAAAVAPLAAPATPASSAIKSWGTARVDGKSKAQRVNAVVEAGGVAYLGGEFKKMVSPSGSKAYRNYLAAIDGDSGALTSWNPKANGKVWALELSADRTKLYVGGDFSKIGDRSVSKLARIDLATGKVDTSFKARSVAGRVRALKLDGGRLYVGGEFGSIDGQPRPKVAALDTATGALLPWTAPPLGQGRYLGNTGIPTPDYSPGHVFAIDVIGSKVFVAGNFTNLGGQGGLVSLDAGTGGLSAPQYEPGRPMFDLATRDGVLYAVGGGPGGRLFAYSPNDRWPLWKVKVDGDAVGVAVSATTVYLAGHYDYIVSKDSSCYKLCPGGPHRQHLSAFDASNGKLLAWDPSADTSTGPFTAAVGANALYVGGEFFKINGSSQPGFAIFRGTP
jgi:hypothetical protein